MALHLKSTGIDFVDFSDAAESSELLDDYEEGTWTVGFYDEASGGNASSTTGTGSYTKVGRMVQGSGVVSNINDDTPTGGNSLHFTIPFTSMATYVGGGTVWWNQIDYNGTYLSIHVPANIGRASVYGTYDNVNSGLAPVLWSMLHVNNTTDMYFSITYQAT